MIKKRRLTNREKKERAEIKKYMQEQGMIPPNKSRLNRKKFIEEAKTEWAEQSECYIWDHYLLEAIGYILCQTEGISSRASLEAVGAAKVLKLAMRLRKFSEEVQLKDGQENNIIDLYNYIKDILEA